MSEEIRTPGGRVLTKAADIADDVTEYRGNGSALIRRPDGRASSVSVLHSSHRGTLAECLAFLDARADETVAALLPPGSFVTTEDAISGACEDAIKWWIGGKDDGEVAEFVAHVLSTIRAGAKS